MSRFEPLCKKVISLCKTTGDFIKKQQVNKADIEEKSKNSLVTYVDKTAEQKIVSRLQDLLPEAGFIAEEGTSEKTGEEWNWIIDPLDGTTNYIHQLPCYSISIALMQNEKLVLGVIYEINNDEMFYSWGDQQAFLNGTRIAVSANEKMEDSLIATGFPYYDYSKLNNYMDALRFFMNNTRGVRRFGSAAADLAYVACGRFDAFYEYSLNPWDVAAGAFIVEQAGGKVNDFSGGKNYLFGKEITAASAAFSPAFHKTILQYF